MPKGIPVNAEVWNRLETAAKHIDTGKDHYFPQSEKFHQVARLLDMSPENARIWYDKRNSYRPVHLRSHHKKAMEILGVKENGTLEPEERKEDSQERIARLESELKQAKRDRASALLNRCMELKKEAITLIQESGIDLVEYAESISNL